MRKNSQLVTQNPQPGLHRNLVYTPHILNLSQFKKPWAPLTLAFELVLVDLLDEVVEFIPVRSPRSLLLFDDLLGVEDVLISFASRGAEF